MIPVNTPKQSTISILPPDIKQFFNSSLLTIHDRWERTKAKIPGLRDKVKRKYKIDGRRSREFEQLVDIFERLYEWQKAQQDYRKEENKEMAQRPIVPTDAIGKLRGFLGKDVRQAFTSFLLRNPRWKNDEI